MWLRGKDPPARSGDTGLIAGSERSPGERNGTHSSILTWKILRTEELGGGIVHGVAKESDTT